MDNWSRSTTDGVRVWREDVTLPKGTPPRRGRAEYFRAGEVGNAEDAGGM